MADAAYLESTVAEALTDGISATAAAQADDPVRFLGEYLLKFAQLKRIELQEAEAAKTLETQRTEAAEEAERRQVEEAPAREAAEARAAEEERLRQLLDSAPAVDDGVLNELAAFLQARTGAASVYIVRKVPAVAKPAAGEGEEEAEEEEEDDDPQKAADKKSQLRYVAVSPGSEELLTKWVDGGKGVTFGCWHVPKVPGAGEEEEEEEEEEEDEDGEPKPPKEVPPPPELPIVHVENVLRRRADVVFHGMPRYGSFTAVPVRYGDCTFYGAVPEPPPPAEEEEGGDGDEEGGDEAGEEEEEDADEEAKEGDDEEGKDEEEGEAAAEASEPEPEPLDPAKPRDADVAICIDTIGQDLPLSPETIDMVKGWADALKAAFERVEAARYPEVYQFVRTAGPAAEEAAKEALAEGVEEEAAKMEEEAAAAGEALGEEAPEDAKKLAEAQAKLEAAKARLQAVGGATAQAIGACPAAPSAEALTLLQSAALVLGAPVASVSDAADPRLPSLPSWAKLRAALAPGAGSSWTAADGVAAGDGAANLVSGMASWDLLAGEGEEEGEGEGEQGAEAGGEAAAAEVAGEEGEEEAEAAEPLPKVMPPPDLPQDDPVRGTAAIRARLEAMDAEALGAASALYPTTLAWVRAAVDVVDALHERAARTQQERVAAEEAAAEAARAAAEAAAAGEGGEDGEGDDDEAEDDD